jgi:hypothetical protein
MSYLSVVTALANHCGVSLRKRLRIERRSRRATRTAGWSPYQTRKLQKSRSFAKNTLLPRSYGNERTVARDIIIRALRSGSMKTTPLQTTVQATTTTLGSNGIRRRVMLRTRGRMQIRLQRTLPAHAGRPKRLLIRESGSDKNLSNKLPHHQVLWTLSLCRAETRSLWVEYLIDYCDFDTLTLCFLYSNTIALVDICVSYDRAQKSVRDVATLLATNRRGCHTAVAKRGESG